MGAETETRWRCVAVENMSGDGVRICMFLAAALCISVRQHGVLFSVCVTAWTECR